MGQLSNLVTGIIIVGAVILLAVLFVAYQSFTSIGAAEVGLVIKNFSLKKQTNNDSIVAFKGEAGY